MNITVDKVQAMSHRRGEAYDCVVLADGVPFVHAHQEGNGGQTDLDYSKYNGTGKMHDPGEMGQRVLDWVKTLPPMPDDGSGLGPMEWTLELVIAEAVDRWDADRKIGRKPCTRS